MEHSCLSVRRTAANLCRTGQELMDINGVNISSFLTGSSCSGGAEGAAPETCFDALLMEQQLDTAGTGSWDHRGPAGRSGTTRN